MKKRTKSLGQIAYEADKSGGQQSFGKWSEAPQLVKNIHENMARAVQKETLNRLVEFFQDKAR